MRLFGRRAARDRYAALAGAGGLAPGQTILEMEPGKGALTDGLLPLVAERGELILQQPAALDAFFGARARRRAERAPNARYAAASWEALDAGDGTVDRVLWVQGPHELWFKRILGRPSRVFAEIARVLAPDGRFLVVDNMAPPHVSDARAGDLHRSNPKTVAALARDTGLAPLREDTAWVGAPHDPRTVPTYDRATKGKPWQWLQVWQRS